MSKLTKSTNSVTKSATKTVPKAIRKCRDCPHCDRSKCQRIPCIVCEERTCDNGDIDKLPHNLGYVCHDYECYTAIYSTKCGLCNEDFDDDVLHLDCNDMLDINEDFVTICKECETKVKEWRKFSRRTGTIVKKKKYEDSDSEGVDCIRRGDVDSSEDLDPNAEVPVVRKSGDSDSD